MDLEMLRYYSDMVNIPIAVYDDGILVQDYCKERFSPDLASYYMREIIRERPPVEILTTSDVVMYGFVASTDTPYYILLGPVQEFGCSRDIARRMLKELGQPYTRVDNLMDFLDKTPRISRSKFLKHLAFLNYLVNRDHPPSNLINENRTSFVGPVPEEEQNIYVLHNSSEYEKRVISCVEFGKTDELINILKNEKSIDAEMGITANDSLRAYKNIFVTSVTLASRSAVRGGMDYEAAMNVSDAYLQAMEDMDDFNEIYALLRNMLIDYTEHTQKCRRLNVTSRLVHTVCNHVAEHMYEKTTVTMVAEALGFSRTYLCSRFKKDTDKNLSQYINEVKIEEAKHLFATTNKSIVEVAGLLGFSSQNYFQTVFKRITGTTPGAYRENTQRLITD